jgi:hypothetical protein
MSKKGFYDILLYVEEEGDVHYNDVLKHALLSKIVGSRSTVTVVPNALRDSKDPRQDRLLRETDKLGTALCFYSPQRQMRSSC